VIAGKCAVRGDTAGQATQHHWLTPTSDVHGHRAILEDVKTLTRQL